MAAPWPTHRLLHYRCHPSIPKHGNFSSSNSAAKMNVFVVAAGVFLAYLVVNLLRVLLGFTRKRKPVSIEYKPRQASAP